MIRVHDMDMQLDIRGHFRDEEELRSVIRQRRVCFDTEPYYRATPREGLRQIGYQLNLYATFSSDAATVTPDSPEYADVQRDLRRIAAVLSGACTPFHMCESVIVDAGELSYSPERGMRPDVVIHVPVFDQENFGHTVDERITSALQAVETLLHSVGAHKKTWRG